tara:strand:- start:146861 stop:147532 length:672 start_codon:yes stop_codon:yes gene_type:complete
MSELVIGIINYGAGNIFSVQNACKTCGIPTKIISSQEELKGIEAIILPGVGSFPQAVKTLKSLGFWKPLLDHISSDKPLLGVCLGMQLMFASSHEHGETEGLRAYENEVWHFEKFYEGEENLRIPHMGWSEIHVSGAGHEVFENIETPFEAYFAHSYMVKAGENCSSNIIGESEYGGVRYCSAIKKGNMVGVQFHPEKSAKKGLQVYKNFYKLCLNWKRKIND